jgi:hypothetical protein
MGHLLSLDDFKHTRESTSSKLDPYWYFTDTRYNDHSFKVENTYPYIVYIHWDHVDGPRYHDDRGAAGKLRVAIRCWIEASVDSDVIYTRITRTYWFVSHKTYYESKERIVHDVTHGYYAFHFQRECDAVAFRLRFTESHTAMAAHHIDYVNAEGDVFEHPWQAKDFARSFLYK